MLSPRYHEFEQEYRLHIDYPGVEAWIAQVPRRSPEQLINWQLWVKKPGDVARAGKSHLRLEIESHLRAWLLRHHRRCLRTLDFAALRAIAKGQRAKPKSPMSEF